MQAWKEKKVVKTCDNSEDEAEEVQFEEVEIVNEEKVEYVNV